MPTAERAGFETSWTSFGDGPRPALMIHCSLAQSGAWRAVARRLAGVLSMTAFDLPGHGRSAPWDGRDEFQKVATGIAASFCETPCDVIGHSFGATVALRLAVEQPRQVRSLVLVEPVIFTVARLDRPDLYARLCAEDADFAEAMAAGEKEYAARLFTDVWGDGTAWEDLPDLQRHVLREQIDLIPAGRTALHDDPGGLLEEGVLQRLDIPVLLIEGSASPPIIGAIHAGLSARLPRARRVVIAGAGHMAPITHADQVSDEILRFLEET